MTARIAVGMQSVPQCLSSRLTLWIGSVRDGFVVLMPLTFFGVAATLIGNFPIPAGRAWLDTTFGPGWTAATDGVVQSTWGMFGLALAVVLASVVARRLPLADGDEVLPPIWPGISALVTRPAPRSCAPSAAWAVRSGPRGWPSSSRPPNSVTGCWNWAATSSRATCTARRCRPWPAWTTCWPACPQALRLRATAPGS